MMMTCDLLPLTNGQLMLNADTQNLVHHQIPALPFLPLFSFVSLCLFAPSVSFKMCIFVFPGYRAR